MSSRLLLQATGITKSYEGVQALRGVDFDLRSGEVHALVGENGAGKSTLIKVLTGAVQPDGGLILWSGDLLGRLTPRTARSLGIAAIYQQPALFPELTVGENMAIGREHGGAFTRVRWSERGGRAAGLLARVGARIDPETEAGHLSMPQQQLVEIARALGQDARVLILDEPTASLGEADAQHLFSVLRELRAQAVGIVYVSHRLEELPLIADRVTVFRDGRNVDTRPMGEVSHAQLIQMMVGRDLESVFPERDVKTGAEVLEMRGLGSWEAGVAGVDLTVRAGEVVGIAGLVGAGRTELARVLFGLTPADAGEIWLRGEAVTIKSPGEAIRHGIAYVPEDRHRHGIVPDLPVSTNVTLASLRTLSRAGRLDVAREREVAAEYVRRLAIKTPSLATPVAMLSGGNQQKVALSRWLMTRPSLLILDEPTQGVDVGAKAEIYALINDLAAQGVAILLISSELPELLGMCDRIAVMRGGTIVGVLNRSEASQETILALALGHTEVTA